ncbi:MAG: SMI1/KNR4 family protein [Acidobacteriota bacterium]|nr:SMI1/KNR4 family protein [Acidobacteriota bacterium]
MWENCLEKLERLKNLDKQFQVFGAEEHQYILNSPLPDEVIDEIAEEIEIPLPLELKRFYAEVGNGIAGPDYGLIDIYGLRGIRANAPYVDVEALKRKLGRKYLDEGNLSGLVSVVAQGCGHEICLITSGEKVGKVVYVSGDGYVSETDQNLVEYYEKWLDNQLDKFEAVEALMRAGRSYQEIDEEISEKFASYDAGDIISSIADAEKPVELFGTPHHKIYSGAKQFPWYEEVLREWQRRNL